MSRWVAHFVHACVKPDGVIAFKTSRDVYYEFAVVTHVDDVWEVLHWSVSIETATTKLKGLRNRGIRATIVSAQAHRIRRPHHHASPHA